MGSLLLSPALTIPYSPRWSRSLKRKALERSSFSEVASSPLKTSQRSNNPGSGRLLQPGASTEEIIKYIKENVKTI